MAKRKPDVIQRFVKQIERNSNKLKKDLKRFSKNAHLPHNLDELAGELRRSAASVASEVEHYLHEISRGAKSAAAAGKQAITKAKPAKRRSSAKKGARKAAKKSARKTAKKATRKAAKKTARKTAKKTTTRKTAKKTTRKAAKKRARS